MLVTGMTMTIVSKLLHSAILQHPREGDARHDEALSTARVLDELFELDSDPGLAVRERLATRAISSARARAIRAC